MSVRTIAILGAGSWGTATAVHLAEVGHKVLLWAHNPLHVEQMAIERANARYLPEIAFPEGLIPISDVSECLKEADDVVIAVPSHAFAEVLSKIDRPSAGLSWLTKGVDPVSHCFLSELVARRFGMDYPMAILSGPSFAKEVAKLLPTALTLAGNNTKYLKRIHQLFHHRNIRVYLSDDLKGVQLCGAVKNVLAIACGVSDGLGYGANAQAALITRGLAEMSRLGDALGAKHETFSGLAGLGDLVLTCTDNQSRNRRFGLKLGEGMSILDAEQRIGQVVEGKHNASQVCAIAKAHAIEMPICEVVNQLLAEQITAQDAVLLLMNRPAKGE